ncbi:hypothetical protein Zmor_012034 [Zophobas morio]|jgi:adenine phosphoribosyltransferase|uniref:Adenine phosphoribosyltransferase n=1 Tax=Zophobas morio TaxID=2755281 RepID=A0AA38HHL5_9CUCU|nr:hypothetical protein Zmor_012034 [Zophobas morio]
MDLKKFILDIKDFPQPGVIFKDITPLLNDVEAFKFVVDEFTKFVKETGANVIVAPEARGFLFAPAVAYAAGCRFVLVRKPGKLPRTVNEVEYSLEYGTGTLQMHQGDLHENDKVVVLDDVLATGGTMDGIIALCHKEKNISIAGIACLIDLAFLHNDDLKNKYNLKTLITY